MPPKVVPPCGYIRDVCYNEHVPEIKRGRTRKKEIVPPMTASQAAGSVPRPVAAPNRTAPVRCDPALAGMLLVFLLS